VFRVALVVLLGLFVIIATWVALWASLFGSINNPDDSVPRALERSTD
jgi:hypothetical protein